MVEARYMLLTRGNAEDVDQSRLGRRRGFEVVGLARATAARRICVNSVKRVSTLILRTEREAQRILESTKHTFDNRLAAIPANDGPGQSVTYLPTVQLRNMLAAGGRCGSFSINAQLSERVSVSHVTPRP